MKRETYYWTCPYCGANLDPDEACDCRKESVEDIKDYKAVQNKEDESNVYVPEKQQFCVSR